MTSIPEILEVLNRGEARYLLVGGYASVIHGVPRTTVDLDVAVEPRAESVRRVLGALRDAGLTPDTDRPDEVLGQGGVTATNDREVDVLTDLPGDLSFAELWESRAVVTFQGIDIPVVSRRGQIRLLRAAGRPQDLEDAAVLERLELEE